MRLLRGRHSMHLACRGGVATIGSFDGVHLGHQSVITQMKTLAGDASPITVILFEPLPGEFLGNLKQRIYPFRECLSLLANLGIDQVLCIPFNLQFAKLSAFDFITSVLVDGLGITHLVIGDDFRFGKGRAGDIHLLHDAGKRFGFSVCQTQTVSLAGVRVSSTNIRNAINAADFAFAKQRLGRAFAVVGRVAHGNKLGSSLGFPTANIICGRTPPPLYGVYAGEVIGADNAPLRCVINAGWRPSIKDNQFSFEVHIPGFSGDLYGQRLQVHLWKKIRDEKKFDMLDDLRQQIAKDIVAAQSIK